MTTSGIYTASYDTDGRGTCIDDYVAEFQASTGVSKILAQHYARAGWDLCKGEVPAIEAADEEASIWSQDDGLAMMR